MLFIFRFVALLLITQLLCHIDASPTITKVGPQDSATMTNYNNLVLPSGLPELSLGDPGTLYSGMDFASDIKTADPLKTAASEYLNM